MKLQQLSIRHFRNITAADMPDLADFNFVHGLNGSGKTSVLEAIYTLSITRSFRSRKIRSVIQQDQDALVVRGRLLPSSAGPQTQERRFDEGAWLGVQRSKTSGALVKLQQEKLASIGELAGILPVQLINPDSFSLVEGAPSHRRQFLDWSVFHVKHLGFYAAWLRYRKALQQRNSLLRRDKIAPDLLAPWDAELIAAGELITACRREQFAQLERGFKEIYQRLADSDGGHAQDYPRLDLRFFPGWDEAKSLEQMLRDNFEGDCRQGFTRGGPHRADIDIRCDAYAAAERLSRGQILGVFDENCPVCGVGSGGCRHRGAY